MNNLNMTTFVDDLANGYKRLAKGTFQEASEIQNQRRADAKLGKLMIYTANLSLFRIRKGNLEYGLSGRKAFDEIAGENIDEFTSQILKEGAYTLTGQQNKQLDELAEDIVWAKAEDLSLIKRNKFDDKWDCFLIDPSDVNADRLTKDQKRFAVKVHGSMEAKYDPAQNLSDYGENMNMLRKEYIKETILSLPTLDHIKQHLKKDGMTVGGASCIYNFEGNSDFVAYCRNVDGSFMPLRGVMKVT